VFCSEVIYEQSCSGWDQSISTRSSLWMQSIRDRVGGGGETGLRHPPQQHMQFANLLRLALKLVPVAVQPVYVADTMHSWCKVRTDPVKDRLRCWRPGVSPDDDVVLGTVALRHRQNQLRLVPVLTVTQPATTNVLRHQIFIRLLSASLYFSKRGAYWDRLCRDVVGCHARALLPNGAS